MNSWTLSVLLAEKEQRCDLNGSLLNLSFLGGC